MSNETRQCANCAHWEHSDRDDKAGGRCFNQNTANTWSLCCDWCNEWKSKQLTSETKAQAGPVDLYLSKHWRSQP
jgi:hypothetical protein